MCDLADGHVAALDYLDQCDGVEEFNLGTGRGVSVLEMVGAFEESLRPENSISNCGSPSR